MLSQVFDSRLDLIERLAVPAHAPVFFSFLLLPMLKLRLTPEPHQHLHK
jgi:hypothetical protein